MRLIFACSPSRKHLALLKKCNVKHVLVSYHFIKDADKLLGLMNGYVPESFTLDSGAFSVWSNGGSIDIEAYIRFAKRLRELLPPQVELNVVNLDVLPGEFGRTPTQLEREESAQKGWENMLKLEAAGLKVIHVYHQHENIEWLDKMRAHLPYIGISPANDCSMKEKLQFMDSCYAKITNTVKTHGFAVTSTSQLYRYPLYSADSSTWTSPARFGRIPIFKDDLSMGTVEYKDKKQVLANWDYLKSIGIEALGADNWEDRTELAIRSFQKLEIMATALWKKRGITWD
jgi:hypothetical protein